MLDGPNQAHPNTMGKYLVLGLECRGELIGRKLICMSGQDTFQKPESRAGRPLWSALAFHLRLYLLYSPILFLHTSTHSHKKEQCTAKNGKFCTRFYVLSKLIGLILRWSQSTYSSADYRHNASCFRMSASKKRNCVRAFLFQDFYDYPLSEVI